MQLLKNPFDIAVSILMSAGLSTLLICLFLWEDNRCNELLHSWARSEYLLVLSKKRRRILKGPFLFAGKNDPVFYVSAKFPDGTEKKGFVHFHFGNPNVKWDG